MRWLLGVSTCQTVAASLPRPARVEIAVPVAIVAGPAGTLCLRQGRGRHVACIRANAPATARLEGLWQRGVFLHDVYGARLFSPVIAASVAVSPALAVAVPKPPRFLTLSSFFFYRI